MTSIEVLAQREANAESARGRADTAWREAWWATTLALGQITGRAAVGRAQRLVADATGNTLRWSQHRTRTGRAFAELGFGGRLTIQPRMAVAVVEAGVEVTDRVLAEIQRAERDGMSLREFTAALTGRAWADTPEGASEATVEAIVTAQPEAAGRAVARNATALRATDNERVALNPTVLGRPPETADGKGMRARLDAANDAEARLSQPIYQAAVLLAGVSEVWDEVWPDLSEVERRQVDRTLGEVLVTIESLRMRLGLEVS